MLWQERGGRGPGAYLLLHGLGATGAVWRGVCREIDVRGDGEWLVVDLPGHGGSAAPPQYSVGAMAWAVAQVLTPDRSWRIVGHSLGVYVGLALASGWFGVRVASVLGIGPKIEWTETDIAAMAELARKPARVFADEAEAWARYRKVSGLDVRFAPDSASLARGVSPPTADSVSRPIRGPRSSGARRLQAWPRARSARCCSPAARPTR